MKIIKKIDDLKVIDKKRPVALIPTMGNLHEGHLSLVKQSINLQLSPLVTIFINPLQFGPNEDFETYPRTIKQDKENLEKQKCEFLFLPEKSELLEGIKKLKAPYSNFLCAKKRPGHFDGVITIVNRFLELINPEYCFFGQKDFQQQLIIRNHLKEKKLSTKLVVGETVRDANGLALSSRNNYLTQNEKKDASIIYKYLKEIADQLRQVRSDFSKDLSVSALMICEEYKNKFEDKGFEIDYLEIINAKNLEKSKKDDTDLLIAIAAHFKGVRLIDNLPCDLSFS
ncbi:MAG: pantoate--beta-alanine ligase [Gammaproteobacteria bacterium]|nr:pantoate--beta-alanine ligase [SAR86 cluster bacterium]